MTSRHRQRAGGRAPPRFELLSTKRFGQDRRMKAVCRLVFIVSLFAIRNARAYSDYVYVDQQLVHVSFDHLIPTFYPTIKPDFDKLRPTTWPLIYPGVPQIHITENLVYPTDQPLLIVE